MTIKENNTLIHFMVILHVLIFVYTDVCILNTAKETGLSEPSQIFFKDYEILTVCSAKSNLFQVL